MTAALLDTHALVWAATAPERLGSRARAIIEDPGVTLLVSAASAWELSTKVCLGRFAEAEALVDGYHDIVETLRGVDLAVSSRHALRAGALRWDHRDPFDRMLAAQAMTEQVTLLSRDAAFDELAGLALTW